MRAFSYIFAATIIARLSSLISFPVTTRILSVADMGELTIWHSIRGLILLATFVGMPDVVAREAGAHKSQKAFYSSLGVSYMILAVLAVGMEAVLDLVPGWVTIPHPRLLIVAAAIDIVPGLMLNTQAAMGRIKAYAVCIVVPALTAAGTTTLLILPPFSLGIVGPLYAHITSSFISALICGWLLLKHQEPPDAPNQRPVDLLKQSLPILGVSLVGMSIATIDRYSIRWFSGAEDLGFYAVVFQAAALLSFGGAAVRTSSISKIIRNIDRPDLITRYFNDYLVCGGMFAVLLAALAPEIIRLLAGGRYEIHVQLAPVLCAAILSLELYSFGQALAVARRESQRAFRSILAAALAALVLVPTASFVAGPLGVALALLVAYAIAATCVYANQATLLPASYGWLAIIAIVLAVLTLHFEQIANIHSAWSMTLRYALAAACAAMGLLRLRALGQEHKA